MFSQTRLFSGALEGAAFPRACATTLSLVERFFLAKRVPEKGVRILRRAHRFCGSAPFAYRRRIVDYFMCLLTSFVISNIETLPRPPKTTLSLSSALIMRRSLASWRPFRLMYCHSFLVISVRGIGLVPTTAERAASGCIGFMNAAFGLRFAPPFFFAAFFLAPPFFAPFFLAMWSPMEFVAEGRFSLWENGQQKPPTRE